VRPMARLVTSLPYSMSYRSEFAMSLDTPASGSGQPKPQSTPGLLSGRSILVVEDESMIWMLIEDGLSEEGCRVIGPASRLDDALRIAASEPVDAALLDVNLGGRPAYPVADILVQRGIPFAFLTGYGEGGIQEAYRHRPVLKKPFTLRGLVALAVSLVERPAA
jgi:CheY-like chemotaxis protein